MSKLAKSYLLGIVLGMILMYLIMYAYAPYWLLISVASLAGIIFGAKQVNKQTTK